MTVTEIDAPVAMMASSPSIPVIDLSQDDEGVLIEALLHAFTTIGFCTLINHGVSQPLIAGAFEASRAFFTCLPTETKLKYKYRDQTSNRGYIPFGSESHLSYTEASNSDRKETMDIGWDDEPGFTNLWPTEEELPSEIFKDILLEYFDIMDTLQLKLMRYIGMGLRLPDPNYLVDRCNGKHENLRLLHYPGFCGSGREASRMRGNAHTDFGTITLLVQDQVGGLKVRRKDGVWLFVEPVENSIIVNVGDVSFMLSFSVHQNLKSWDNLYMSVCGSRLRASCFCNFPCREMYVVSQLTFLLLPPLRPTDALDAHEMEQRSSQGDASSSGDPPLLARTRRKKGQR